MAAASVCKVRIKGPITLKPDALCKILSKECKIYAQRIYKEDTPGVYTLKVDCSVKSKIAKVEIISKLKKKQIEVIQPLDSTITANRTVFVRHVPELIWNSSPESLCRSINMMNGNSVSVRRITKVSGKSRLIKLHLEAENMAAFILKNGLRCKGLQLPSTLVEKAKRPDYMQCFRCLKLGHAVKDCTDETSTCIKCGKSGHIAKTCKEDIRCLLCNGQHLASSLSCPKKYKQKTGATYAAVVASMKNEVKIDHPESIYYNKRMGYHMSIAALIVSIAFETSKNEEEFNKQINDFCKENDLPVLKIPKTVLAVYWEEKAEEARIRQEAKKDSQKEETSDKQTDKITVEYSIPQDDSCNSDCCDLEEHKKKKKKKKKSKNGIDEEQKRKRGDSTKSSAIFKPPRKTSKMEEEKWTPPVFYVRQNEFEQIQRGRLPTVKDLEYMLRKDIWRFYWEDTGLEDTLNWLYHTSVPLRESFFRSLNIYEVDLEERKANKLAEVNRKLEEKRKKQQKYQE